MRRARGYADVGERLHDDGGNMGLDPKAQAPGGDGAGNARNAANDETAGDLRQRAAQGDRQALMLLQRRRQRAKSTGADAAKDGAAAQDGAGAKGAATGAPDATPVVEGAGETGGPLAEDKSLALLNAAFKDYKAISKGDVQVLEQAEFQKAYDKIYGSGEYAWDKYVKPKWGNLNGFAYGGVNYINKAHANTGTVPHEMLHNNAASDWRDFVGNQFDEGATDYLKQFALKKSGLTSPNSYEAQLSVVHAYMATGVAEEQLFTAYLKGGAPTIVGKWVDEHCAGSWADVKAASQAQDYTRAKVKLGPKKAGGDKDAKDGKDGKTAENDAGANGEAAGDGAAV